MEMHLNSKSSSREFIATKTLYLGHFDDTKADVRFSIEQGKKVCKTTAVRCAHLFLFAGIAEKLFGHPKKSYSGELLTARTAVKMKTYFLKSPNGVLISYSERCSHTWHSKRFDARRLAQTGMRFFRRVRSS